MAQMQQSLPLRHGGSGHVFLINAYDTMLSTRIWWSRKPVDAMFLQWQLSCKHWHRRLERSKWNLLIQHSHHMHYTCQSFSSSASGMGKSWHERQAVLLHQDMVPFCHVFKEWLRRRSASCTLRKCHGDFRRQLIRQRDIRDIYKLELELKDALRYPNLQLGWWYGVSYPFPSRFT